VQAFTPRSPAAGRLCSGALLPGAALRSTWAMLQFGIDGIIVKVMKYQTHEVIQVTYHGGMEHEMG